MSRIQDWLLAVAVCGVSLGVAKADPVLPSVDVAEAAEDCESYADYWDFDADLDDAAAAAARRCSDNGDCGGAFYCAKAVGDCDGEGTCKKRPRVCPLVYQPVCGCDGNTYGNSCEAAAAGVNVAHTGECDMPQYCGSNAQCGPNDYCAKAAGNCNGIGTCSPRPEACLDVYDPVCGCDGVTYSNACYAAQAGVNVDYQGECVSSCFSNDDCPGLNHYCAKAQGDCLGIGACEPRPWVCPDIYFPVCGCDGNTYDNSCYAAGAGVNIAYAGECFATESRAGGSCVTNADCGWREYCKKARGDCDGVGVCSTRPRICLDVWIPVCGCNGNIYSNDCYAARAGVNVRSTGYCAE